MDDSNGWITQYGLRTVTIPLSLLHTLYWGTAVILSSSASLVDLSLRAKPHSSTLTGC